MISRGSSVSAGTDRYAIQRAAVSDHNIPTPCHCVSTADRSCSKALEQNLLCLLKQCESEGYLCYAALPFVKNTKNDIRERRVKSETKNAFTEYLSLNNEDDGGMQGTTPVLTLLH